MRRFLPFLCLILLASGAQAQTVLLALNLKSNYNTNGPDQTDWTNLMVLSGTPSPFTTNNLGGSGINLTLTKSTALTTRYRSADASTPTGNDLAGVSWSNLLNVYNQFSIQDSCTLSNLSPSTTYYLVLWANDSAAPVSTTVFSVTTGVGLVEAVGASATGLLTGTGTVTYLGSATAATACSVMFEVTSDASGVITIATAGTGQRLNGLELISIPAPAGGGGTWLNTGATSGSWSQSTNWVSGTVPGLSSGTTNTDTALFNTAVGTYGTSGSPILVDANRNIKNITFDSGVGNFVISGNYLTFSTGGTTQITSAVTTAAVETIKSTSGLVQVYGDYTFANSGTNSGAILNIGSGNNSNWLQQKSGGTMYFLGNDSSGINVVNYSVQGAVDVKSGKWAFQGTYNNQNAPMSLIESGSVSFSSGVYTLGNLTITGGTVSAAAFAPGATTSGTYIQNGGVVNITTSNFGSTSTNYNTSYNMQSGTFQGTGTPVFTSGASSTTGMNFSGGTVKFPGTLTGAANAYGKQFFNWTGGTLATSVDATYLSATAGGVTGTLVNSGSGILSPGVVSTTATTTVTGGYNVTSTSAVMSVGISGSTTYNKIVVTGTATLGGTLKLNLGGYTPPTTGTFTIMPGSVGSVISGTFANVVVIDSGTATYTGGTTSAIFMNGKSYGLSYTSGTGNSLALIGTSFGPTYHILTPSGPVGNILSPTGIISNILKPQ